MILKRIELINFRQYEHLILEFKEGITGIVGPNGAGKSTILEAISWCLFGNRAARTGKEGIKRQTAPPADPCHVELEFVLGDNAYTLNRSLIGKTNRTEARLSQAGRLDAVSTREVDDYIVRLIGLDLKGFLSSFFARQKELNALSEARPAARKDHLARMLGVGRLDSAILLLKEEIKSTRQRIEILSGLQIDPVVATEELNRKKAEIAALDKSRAESAEALKNAESQIRNLQKDVEDQRRREKEINNLDKDSAAFSARKDALEKQIKAYEAEIKTLDELATTLEPARKAAEGIEELEKSVADLRQAKDRQTEHKRLKDEVDKLSGMEDGRKQEQTGLQSKIEEWRRQVEPKPLLVKNIKKLEISIESLRQELRELNAEIRVIEDKLATMAKQKSEIAELGPEASCKLCLRPFAGELDEIERHFDQEILSFQQQLNPMKKRLDEITEKGKAERIELERDKNSLEKLYQVERDLASAQANLQAMMSTSAERLQKIKENEQRLAEIGAIEFDPDKLRMQEAALKEKQTRKEEYIRLLERAERRPVVERALTKSHEEIQSIDRQLADNQAKREAVRFDRDLYEKITDRLEKDREAAGNIRVEIEKTEGQIRLLNSEAANTAKKLEDFEKSKTEIRTLRESLTYFEELSGLFSEFRVYLIGRIRPSLSKRTSELFYEMTGGRYQEIELDEDYSLRVYDRGEAFPIDRFSGGEVDLANLCFRLAISVEMAGTAGIDRSFIILDEIFGSQDADRQRLIFEGLGRLKNRFMQIIIISHIDDVKEMAENLITVAVDPAGVSRATVTGRQ